MFEQKLIDNLLKKFEKAGKGRLNLTLPGGKNILVEGSQEGSDASLHIHHPSVIRNMVLGGDVAFAEDYRKGLWDSDDLTKLVEFGITNKSSLVFYLQGSLLPNLMSRFIYFTRRNNKSGSKRNIHAHYDLGNEFYSLWLDPTMSYSSALYDYKSQTSDLKQAQYNKYDRIIERLPPKTKNILEIGCGWGGFAERLANAGEASLTGLTISPSQCGWARKRLGGKKGQIDIRLEDYRDVSGKYDAIVSIEMFEAVGERYWKTYFAKVKSLLAEGGKAIIQVITINDDAFSVYRRGTDLLRSYIFPGGMLPSPSAFKKEAERAGLKIVERFCFGKHYARTLNQWINNFNECEEEILARNFDIPFMRLWRLYLASCSGAFAAGHIDVEQVELAHAKG